MTREEIRQHLAPLIIQERVWYALGSKGKEPDRPFLDWLTTQPCKRCGRMATPYLSVVPAHYRKVRYGAGVSCKPPFRATSLCNDCHQLSHGKDCHLVADDETWDRWVMESLFAWVSLRLLQIVRKKDWEDVPLADLLAWEKHGLVERLNYLPPKLAAKHLPFY